MKKITLSDDSYWKLIEIKTRMRCRTWKELVDKLHAESQPGTSRPITVPEERIGRR